MIVLSLTVEYDDDRYIHDEFSGSGYAILKLGPKNQIARIPLTYNQWEERERNGLEEAVANWLRERLERTYDT